LTRLSSFLLDGNGIDALGIGVTTGATLGSQDQRWAQDLDYETEFEQQEVGHLRCFRY
ncbi:hypothetical protein Tco_0616821, partial [Tanacetum coccineum]